MEGVSVEEMEENVLPYLSSSVPSGVKMMAIDAILSLMKSSDGKAFIRSADKYLESLVSLTEDADEDISKKTFSILINLAADSRTSEKLWHLPNHPNFAFNCLQKATLPDFKLADNTFMLLSNLTRSEKCAGFLMEFITKDAADIVTVSSMIDVLSKINYNPHANLHHLADVLCNISQIPSARSQILEFSNLLKLFPLLTLHKSVVRRKGVAGILRNCCFETAYHEWLLGEEVDILPVLLLPLAGPEELDEDDNDKLPFELQYLPPDKEREPDASIRKMLVEAIFQLCATKKPRLFIKQKNAYAIMRELHRWETDRANNVAITNLVDILIGDEPPEELSDLKDISIPGDLREKFKEEDGDLE